MVERLFTVLLVLLTAVGGILVGLFAVSLAAMSWYHALSRLGWSLRHHVQGRRIMREAWRDDVARFGEAHAIVRRARYRRIARTWRRRGRVRLVLPTAATLLLAMVVTLWGFDWPMALEPRWLRAWVCLLCVVVAGLCVFASVYVVMRRASLLSRRLKTEG